MHLSNNMCALVNYTCTCKQLILHLFLYIIFVCMNSDMIHNIYFKQVGQQLIFIGKHQRQLKILIAMRVTSKPCNLVSTLSKINKQELLKSSFPAEKVLMPRLACIQNVLGDSSVHAWFR